MVLNTLYMDLVRYVVCLCSFIPASVCAMLGWQLFGPYEWSMLDNENDQLEFAWTVVPTFGIIGLCCFNVRCLLYDYFTPASAVVKIVGHQWYWNYEVSHDPDGSYDSYMCDFLNSVDKPLRLHYRRAYSLLVTSADVIHSFALPSFKFKVDAVPGRINQVSFFADRLGVFVGYCSELCGAGHAYMPIVVEVVDPSI
uniref:cytochrome-c oxidase n=1 Tax=Lyperosomum longicauda TaxID=2714089 RepID=A0A6H0YBB7_9TREM|nr:cytochrome c oxidase subunit 2 [Lyperosomum longicauda]QIX04658.1 cytochrome c oxidase subunit 2 [Lyperosomum longicauda]